MFETITGVMIGMLIISIYVLPFYIVGKLICYLITKLEEDI